MDTATQLYFRAIITKSSGVLINQVTRGMYKPEDITKCLFDGKAPERSWEESWYCIPVLPSKITHMVGQPDINHRFDLIDPSMESEQIPATFKREEVAKEGHGTEYSWEWGWFDKYKHLYSLYKAVSDSQDGIEQELEFDIETLDIEIDNIKTPKEICYRACRVGSWSSEKYIVTKDKVQHQLIDTILFPKVLLATRPTKMSSRQTYDIVRAHIKDHHDKTTSKIVDDYDFCFKVEKRIAGNPYSVVTEKLTRAGRSYRKPRYNTRWVNSRGVVLFEMTTKGKPWQKYTPIEGFSADTADELVEQIDTYLAELMAVINAPVEDCTHCGGTGVQEQTTSE